MAILLQVLILAAQLDDAELIVRELRRAGLAIDWRCVVSESEYVAALSTPIDLVLFDCELLAFEAQHALRLLQEHELDLPFIVIGGAIWQATAIACIKQGADDYVGKDQLARLGPAIEQAISQQQRNRERRQAEQALRERQVLNQMMLASLSVPLVVLDASGRIMAVNNAWTRFIHSDDSPTQEHIGVGTNYLDVYRRAVGADSAEARQMQAGLEAVLSGARTQFMIDYPWPAATGARWFGLRMSLLEGQQRGVIVVHADITERKRSEQALRRQTMFVQLLQAIAVAANEARSIASALQIAVDQICTRIGWPVGHVYLSHEHGGHTFSSTDIWYLADLERFARFRTSTEAIDHPGINQLSGRVFLSGKPAWIADMTATPNLPSGDIGVRAGFAFPVLVGAEVAAVLEFFSAETIAPDEMLLDVMAHVGTQLGRVVERVRAEIALRDSEERYRLISENTEDIISLLDRAGRHIYVSPACERLLGRCPADLIDRSFLEYVHPDDCAGLQEQMALFEGRSAVPTILRCRHADGSWRWFESRATTITQHGTTYIMSVNRDVTARKQAEEALRAAEAKYRTLVEQIPAIIYTAAIDELSSTNYVSPQIGAILGFTPEEWIADPNFWYTQVHPEDRARVLASVGRAHASDQTIPEEYRSFTRDGRIIWLQDTSRVVRDDAGQPLLLQGILLDITERKRAEDALVEERSLLARRVEERTADLSAANAELARASRLKDEFLASMSHELRTPLNAILGLSEALQEQIYGALNGQQRKTLGSIEASGRHLLELINDILDLAKIGAGKLELETEPVAVEPIYQASLQLVKQAAHKKRITVELSIDPAIDSVRADARRLKQILVNLLSNAIKFTPEGGAVGLDVTCGAAQQVIRFQVWDTGIGIAQSEMEKLFQPFFQLDSRLARQYEGTGLGLALVYRMVEMHGGSVAVTSEVGVGSRFTISLPWQSDELLPAPQLITLPKMIASTHTAIQTALIVEDSPSAADKLRRYLNELGLLTVTHMRGEDCVERAVETRPDVILLDILLPDLSGWNVLMRLKADPRTHMTPVVIVSVLDEQARAAMLGAADYLVKPVTRQDIQRALARLAPANYASPASTLVPMTPGQDRVLTLPRILLAEDNEANIITISDYLIALGNAVVVARNGIEVIARAREIAPAIILMDIQMPEMDGLEAMQRIRADSELAAIPIIALTAMAMQGDRERCLAAGANDYLSKPVSLKALVAAIQTHMLPQRDQGGRS